MKWMPEAFQEIITPFSWKHFEDLDQLIARIENGMEDEWREITMANLQNYQIEHLSGDAIFEKMVNSNELLICAEERSVQLYQHS